MDRGYFDEIPSDIFTNIQQIGTGTFSDVFSAIHINTNTEVALKISLKTDDEVEMKLINQEILIHKSLDHPFVCKYFTSIETDHLKIIVMENIEGITALDYVNQTHGLPYQDAVDLFTQLIIVIEYLHDEAHITHRDLKLENIMIDKYNHIRLIDFGFSSLNTMMTSCCGSVPYCAPEIISGQIYTNTADIWSLGIILYTFINGNLPFIHPNMNSLASMIMNNDVIFTPNFTDPASIDLIQKMLIKDPQRRITIDGIKRHPFLAQQKLLQIEYKQLFQSIDANLHSSLLVSKSSASIEINNSASQLPMLKGQASSDEKTRTQCDFALHDLDEDANFLDQSIISRKDFPSNLNKLIHSALLNGIPQHNIPLHLAHSGPNLIRRRYNYIRRSSQQVVFRNVSPVVHPNINNLSIISKRLFDKK